jgi:hypothetical protein
MINSSGALDPPPVGLVMGVPTPRAPCCDRHPPPGHEPQAAEAAIYQACRMLRLPTIRGRFGDLAETAARE